MVTLQCSRAEEGDKPPILQMEQLSPREGKQLSQALQTRSQDPQPLSSPPTHPAPGHSAELPWGGKQTSEFHEVELKAEALLLLTDCPRAPQFSPSRIGVCLLV